MINTRHICTERILILGFCRITDPLRLDYGTKTGFCILGPFRWIDQYGADKLVAEMKRIRDAGYGEPFEPCQMLVDYANESKRFHTV